MPQITSSPNFPYSLSTSKSKVYLHAIDRAHELLEHDRDLAEKVPSCVVVGMQSVGKSAVLSRISGISFPQDSEVCTRVAIELRLRRAQHEDTPSKPMKIKAGNLETINIDKLDNEAIESALKEAQVKVLNGKTFEDKLSVKLEKEDKNCPEVTLIDLPGVFFAKDDEGDELEYLVKDMIQDRVNNDMALIMHVVPLNQDTDTISTWRVVRDADEAQNRTISILTKADLALKDGKEILKKRLQKILTDSKSSECFIIHGAAKDTEEEDRQLAMVGSYIHELGLSDNIKVGVKELNEFIEDRMLNHIQEKLPEMRGLLEKEIHVCEIELNKLGREPISSIAISLRDANAAKAHLSEAYASHQPEFRRLTEKMTEEIFGIDLEPLGIVDADEAKRALQRVAIDSDYVKILEGYYNDHLLALEVKKVGDDSRGMINVPYVGKKAELKIWLDQFMQPFENVLIKYISDIFKIFDEKIFRPALVKGCSEPTKLVLKTIEASISRDVIMKGRNDAMCYGEYLVQSVKENIFTTNDRYLTHAAEKFRDELKESLYKLISHKYKTGLEAHFNTICEIKAFLKTRKKVLPDAIQLHFIKALNDIYKETEKQIGVHMFDEKTRSMIKESSRSVTRREFYLQRESKVKAALEEISLL